MLVAFIPTLTKGSFENPGGVRGSAVASALKKTSLLPPL